MMLSPQAARMGTVQTTLRSIGKTYQHLWWRSSSTLTTADRGATIGGGKTGGKSWGGKNGVALFKGEIGGVLSRSRKHPMSTQMEDIDTPSGCSHSGIHANASTLADNYYTNGPVRSASPTSSSITTTTTVPEPWMVNLGREDDTWLRGPRPAEWFTGVAPRDCPGADTKGILHSCPLPNLSRVTRAAAQEYFDNSWTLYETLFAGLRGEEGFYRPPPHGLRHPQIFYYGHTACLYINKLRVAGVLDKPVNPYFESIFEVGVDEMLWDDMHKNDMVWPTVAEVHAYRQEVYRVVSDAIANHPSLAEQPCTVDQDHPMWALFMGFEHERIHLETSSVLFRETPLHLVQRPENWPPLHPSALRPTSGQSTTPTKHSFPENAMIPVEPGTVDLGKPADFPSFGWDNEYGERQTEVGKFYANRYMITNGEFWEFVQDGGYRTRKYWTDDSWNWRTHRNLKWPFFWEPAGPAGSHEYQLRTIFDVVAMPWDWPVDVTYYEAKAFCAWKNERTSAPGKQGFRLLTEAEHHLIRHSDHNLQAARQDVDADKVMSTEGKNFDVGPTGSNLNMVYGSQNPVDFFPPSQTGHYDTTGSSWEWTEDHFNPLRGFEVHHVYDDFSSPCFDGKHSMIVGGSFMSTGDEASVFARFHFRPHFLQHSGFRMVSSDHDAPAKHLFAGNFDGQAAAAAAAAQQEAAAQTATTNTNTTSASTTNVYETDDSLHMYLGLHYPDSNTTLEGKTIPPFFPHDDSPNHALNFPRRVVGILNKLTKENNVSRNRALDLGCAVGGASFDLAKTFGMVDAVDFSAQFIGAAQQLQKGEELTFDIPMEADYKETVAVQLDATEEERARVKFAVGDACNLDTANKYDGVILSNLLCRLPNPVACLDGLGKIVNDNGVVVLVTPFSWLEEFTPRQHWLGGFRDPVSNQPILSKDVLKDLMEARGFTKMHEEQIPLVIREHQRKLQYIVSEASGWQKKKE